MNSGFDLSRYPDWVGKTLVIYDGQCPFCSNYVRFQRLRETLKDVVLLDAREFPDLVQAFATIGAPLDDGMALIMDGRIFYGAECINRLALLSSRRGWFNKINAAIFRSPTASRTLYPAMKLGRSVVLRLMRRGKLSEV